MSALTMSHRSKDTVGKPQFELPALNLNFGSITDGTNIPPPLPSPKVPTPPQTPPRLETKDDRTNGSVGANRANGLNTESQLPASQSVPALDGVDRPQSRGGFSLMGDRKSKRSSGWFKRFRSGDQQSSSRRSSFLFSGSSSNLPAAKQLEPPPPMIPELRELEKDEGSLGSDIFRNIK
ncbi:hypothetical protein LMH87_002239 [Akanthomyces muscarius]|uniref:Uncharacterized protein n=1 Tax=Akanthomyces muscarius TaxID=2231603 RepID=A0A9W8Q6P9_AKAMU|nr:hypothetical protein LMH87_002239 [Akanthomyces muscarius]KAJ4147732.1 hypothetical protein LMH87_002239 [Akanthomyces muscarius]